jgi:hypothetical protein
MSTDPPRLRDDPASPEGLRELMEHGEPPPPMDPAVKAASAAAVAALGSSATAAASSTAAAGVKLWLVVGALTAVTGAVTGVVLTREEARPAERAAAERPEGAARVAAPPAEPTERVEAPLPREPVAPDEAGAAADAPAPAGEAEAAVARAPRRGPSRRAERTPEAAPDEPAAAEADTLVAEARILEQARRLLAADPAAALARTDAHARRFPGGQLAAEREVIAIDALCRLDRRRRARRRARRLIESAPEGIYAERARAMIAALPEE